MPAGGNQLLCLTIRMSGIPTAERLAILTDNEGWFGRAPREFQEAVLSRFGAGDNPLLHVVHEGFRIGYGTVVASGEPRVSAVARVDTLLAGIPDRTLRALLDARPEWWEVIANGIRVIGHSGSLTCRD